MTEQPTTSSFETMTGTYSFTTGSKPYDPIFDKTEAGILSAYQIIASLLTLVLNAYLLYVIVFKISLKKSSVFIPIFTGSLLGLFHGVGINLVTTISFINKSWVGLEEWCGASAVLHQFLIYVIVYCQTITCIEAAYLISHPHGYSRTSPKAKRAMVLATVFAVFISIPILICHFFYLKPSNIKEVYPSEDYSHVHEMVNTKDVFFYDEDVTFMCYRQYFLATLDYKVLVYTVLVLNFTAVSLIMGSFLTIVFVVLRMQYRRIGPSDQRSARDKKQNRKIALMAIVTTLAVSLPWSVNNIFSLLNEITEFRNYWYGLEGLEGVHKSVRYPIYYFMVYSYYLIPIIFPLMNVLANPAVSKITKTLLSKIEQHTIVPLSMAVHQPSSSTLPLHQAKLNSAANSAASPKM